VIDIDPAVAGIDAVSVIRALQEGAPPISVFERFATSGTIVIMPEAFLPGEAAVLSRRVKEILAGIGS
jgi:hypothetical protein